MKNLIAPFLLAVTLATPAAAGDSPLYVGAEVGKDHFGVLGGYKFNDMIAAEMNYTQFDDETISVPFVTTEVEAWAVGVAAVANFPIDAVPGLSVFGKAGVEYVEIETTITTDFFGTVTTTSASDDDIDFAGSVGAQYEFTPSFSVRGGVHVKGRADSVYANAIYRF